MTEIHSRETGFKYNASGPFTKNKERIQKFRFYICLSKHIR